MTSVRPARWISFRRSVAMMSVATAMVQIVDPDDVVDPVDAALQGLLAAMVENTDGVKRRDTLIDHILTVPPFREWPAQFRAQLDDTCKYVVGLAGQLRQRHREASEESDVSASADAEPGPNGRQLPT
jgi:hypothetical protein